MKIGFLEMLTLIFAAAKVFGYITWSWWLVFIPIWLPLLVIGAVVVAVASISALASKMAGKKWDN